MRVSSDQCGTMTHMSATTTRDHCLVGVERDGGGIYANCSCGWTTGAYDAETATARWQGHVETIEFLDPVIEGCAWCGQAIKPNGYTDDWICLRWFSFRCGNQYGGRRHEPGEPRYVLPDGSIHVTAVSPTPD